MLVADSEGDDLLKLSEKLLAGVNYVRAEQKRPSSARTVAARMAIPTLGNISGAALEAQSRQRQLVIAVAVERYWLAHGTIPESVEEMVPAILSEIPDDPYLPGTKFELVPPLHGERYRIGSSEPGRILAIPDEL